MSGSSRCSRQPIGCDCPMLLHPARGAEFADYATRDQVQVRNLVDVRLALRDERRDAAAGVLAPVRPSADIKIVAHHLGAMIPYFEGRVGYGLDQFGTRTADEDYEGLPLDAETANTTTSRCSGPTRRCSAAERRRNAASTSSASIRWCSPRTLRSTRGRATLHPRDDQGDRRSRHQRTSGNDLSGQRGAAVQPAFFLSHHRARRLRLGGPIRIDPDLPVTYLRVIGADGNHAGRRRRPRRCGC